MKHWGEQRYLLLQLKTCNIFAFDDHKKRQKFSPRSFSTVCLTAIDCTHSVHCGWLHWLPPIGRNNSATASVAMIFGCLLSNAWLTNTSTPFSIQGILMTFLIIASWTKHDLVTSIRHLRHFLFNIPASDNKNNWEITKHGYHHQIILSILDFRISRHLCCQFYIYHLSLSYLAYLANSNCQSCALPESLM